MGYKIWFEGIDEENTKTGGVALAINNQLIKHVTEIGRYMGRIIWAILKYKGKPDLWIINIYVNSDLKEKTERKMLLKKLKDLLKNAEDKKEDVILLGDLNADREKWEQNDKLQNKEKYLILETIKNANLFDTQRITTEENTEIKQTWIKNNKTKRRLDYNIWINDNLLDKLTISKIWDIENLESDHKLLTIKMNANIVNRLQRNRSGKKKKGFTRTKYLSDTMTEEDWEKYKTLMDKKIDKYQLIKCWNNKLKSNIIEEKVRIKRINDIWNIIENIIKETMDETIKKMEVVKSEYEFITKKISPLRKFVKIIGKIISESKKDTLYRWGFNYKKMIMDKLEDYDQKYPGILPNLTEVKENLIFNKSEWLINNLSESKKKLRPKMKIEETIRREKQIKDAIELRIKELDTDKKNFLTKSLERTNNRIGIN